MEKRRKKPAAREFREVEVGYTYGPYDGQHLKVKWRMQVPRDASMRQIINHIRPPGDDTEWVSVAWRKRVYWEFARRKKDGIDLRLVARLVRQRDFIKELIPIYSED